MFSWVGWVCLYDRQILHKIIVKAGWDLDIDLPQTIYLMYLICPECEMVDILAFPCRTLAGRPGQVPGGEGRVSCAFSADLGSLNDSRRGYPMVYWAFTRVRRVGRSSDRPFGPLQAFLPQSGELDISKKSGKHST